MGLVKLNQRLNDPAFSPWFEGLFPRDSLGNMRFSINFFTSIGGCWRQLWSQCWVLVGRWGG